MNALFANYSWNVSNIFERFDFDVRFAEYIEIAMSEIDIISYSVNLAPEIQIEVAAVTSVADTTMTEILNSYDAVMSPSLESFIQDVSFEGYPDLLGDAVPLLNSDTLGASEELVTVFEARNNDLTSTDSSTDFGDGAQFSIQTLDVSWDIDPVTGFEVAVLDDLG